MQNDRKFALERGSVLVDACLLSCGGIGYRLQIYRSRCESWFIFICFDHQSVLPFGSSLSAASDTNSCSNSLHNFEMITSSIKTGFYGGLRSCYLNKSLIDKNILKQLDKLFPLIVIPVVPSMINTNALLFHATCIDIVQFQSEMFIRGF